MMLKRVRVVAFVLVLTLAGGLAAMAAPPDWAGANGQKAGHQEQLAGGDRQQEADRDQDRERLRDGSFPGEKSVSQQVYSTTGNKGLDLKLQVKARVHVRLHGQEVDWAVPPVIKEGRTLVPVRALCNGLGAAVDWDPDTRTITITRGDTVIKLALDSRVFTVNGQVRELDVPAQLISNATFVPLRFVSQALGEKVNYQQQEADEGAVVDIAPATGA
ncbi:hypothetical protein MOTE_05040 [Moorella thermoacetica]|uniref:Copper amine oxidase-like N-terminal domain-containing protein n=1 Tax=Neomoorella thermoacetica TaxID=1525 RepID=A0A1J5NZ19_NEOTH|nr:hypothetical protein MOTE_05040 [Moorella thermoacetica]